MHTHVCIWGPKCLIFEELTNIINVCFSTNYIHWITAPAVHLFFLSWYIFFCLVVTRSWAKYISELPPSYPLPLRLIAKWFWYRLTTLVFYLSSIQIRKIITTPLHKLNNALFGILVVDLITIDLGLVVFVKTLWK